MLNKKEYMDWYTYTSSIKEIENLDFIDNVSRHNIMILIKKVLSDDEKQQYKQRVNDIINKVNNNVKIIYKKPFFRFLKNKIRRVV